MECILGGTDLSPPIETLDLGGGGGVVGRQQLSGLMANIIWSHFVLSDIHWFLPKCGS